MPAFDRPRWYLASVATICVALAGCATNTSGHGSGRSSGGPAPQTQASSPVAPSVTPAETPTATQAAAPELRGNAATNPACKLLSIDQVATISGLAVNGLLGLPRSTASNRYSESCTWYLDSKDIQASLVVQYTLYARAPTELVTYYRQTIKDGYYKRVPQLGDVAKIDKHAVDAIDKRVGVSVILLVHAEATAEDQAADIQFTRLVLKGIAQ
ncbi:MAG: hypothetical protein DLM58_05935 [Pseudonocardiales bacterium]|nr:MAG: hypothetical protein DLM58_05935 [Pseudonocardiales bacterium]